jgi:hypothetical protein
MGKENSSVTRVWPVFSELMCSGRSSEKSLRTVFDVAHSKHRNQLAATLRDFVEPVFSSLLEKPVKPRTVYEQRLRLPACFEYQAAAPERLLLWLIEHAGRECVAREGLPPSQRDAGRRRELFGTNESAQRSARQDATDELLKNGSKRSKQQWWAFEGETSIDCFLETPGMVFLIEGKRNEPISSSTDWVEKRNQIARNLEVAQTLARGRRYAVLLAAERETHVEVADITGGLPHMTSSEQMFLAEHYLGCVTWLELCAAAGLPIDLADLSDVDSAVRWFCNRGFGA